MSQLKHNVQWKAIKLGSKKKISTLQFKHQKDLFLTDKNNLVESWQKLDVDARDRVINFTINAKHGIERAPLVKLLLNLGVTAEENTNEDGEVVSALKIEDGSGEKRVFTLKFIWIVPDFVYRRGFKKQTISKAKNFSETELKLSN